LEIHPLVGDKYHQVTTCLVDFGEGQSTVAAPPRTSVTCVLEGSLMIPKRSPSKPKVQQSIRESVYELPDADKTVGKVARSGKSRCRGE
jgi:hypothetical protein